MKRSIVVAALCLVACTTATDARAPSAVPGTTTGDGFTVVLPDGFTGGTTPDEMRSAIEAAFPPEAVGPLMEQLSAGRAVLFAVGPIGLQATVLFTTYIGPGTLEEVSRGYLAELRSQGVRAIDARRVRIDGARSTLLSYLDPTNGVRTDSYIVPGGGGGGRILEYSALRSRFDELAVDYRESAQSFRSV